MQLEVRRIPQVEIETVVGMTRTNIHQFKAFLGMSLTQTYFSKERIESYVAWGNANFSKFLLIIDDFEFRHNFEVFDSLSPQAASSKAKSIGREKLRALQKILRKLNTMNETLLVSDLFENATFIKILSVLTIEAEINQTFKEVLYAQVYTNIGSYIESWLRTHHLNREQFDYSNLQNLSQFILEEVAVSLYVRHVLGFTIEVYPAPEMRIFNTIYTDKKCQVLPKLGYSAAPYGYIEAYSR